MSAYTFAGWFCRADKRSASANALARTQADALRLSTLRLVA